MIKIAFYAQLRDFFGEETEVELPANAVAADIRAVLTESGRRCRGCRQNQAEVKFRDHSFLS